MKYLLLHIVLLFFALTAKATNYTSAVITGNWNNSGSWTPAGIPVAGDTVSIISGHTITTTAAAACKKLTVNSGGKLLIGAFNFSVSDLTSISDTIKITSTSGTKSFKDIVINSGGVWYSTATETNTISGNLTLNGGTISGTTTGVFTVTGNLLVNASTTNTVAAATLTINGTTDIYGSIAFTSTSGSKTFKNTTLYNGAVWNNTIAETFTINGNLALNGATISGTGTSSYTVSGTLTIAVATSNNINACNINITGDANINGVLNFGSTTGTKTLTNVIIASTGVWTSTANESFTIKGNFTNNGSITPGTGTYTLSGAAKSINATRSVTLGAVAITGSITNNTYLIINGTLSGAGSLVNNSNDSIQLQGSITITTLNATSSGNTVIYLNSSNQTIKSTPYYNLVINKSAGTATLGGATTISNNLTIVNGTLADGGFQITGNTSGSLTMQNSSTLRLGSATVATAFPTLFTSDKINLSTNSTVNYYSNLSQTISNVPVYGKLTLYSTVAISKTVQTPLTVKSTLTVSANNTFNLGSGVVTVKGNISNSGSISGSGYILISNGTAAHTISGGTSSFSNIVISDASYSTTLSGTAATTITGKLTVQTGSTLLVGAVVSGLNVQDSTKIYGTLRHTSTSGTKTFATVAIYSTGIWSTSVAESITISGNIYNDGTFSSGTGTYTLSGSTKTLSGAAEIPISTLSITGSYTNNTSLTVATALSGAGSLTNGLNSTLTLTGTISITTLNALSSVNTVIYNSTAANQTTKSTGYHHLTINKAGYTATLGGATTVNGNLSILAGTLSDGNYVLTGNATGLFTIANGATFKIMRTAAASFPAAFIKANINMGASSIISYAASGSQTVSNTPDYTNLTIAGSGTKTLGGSILVSNDLIINAGTGLDASTSNYSITLGGNMTNNGTFVPRSATVIFNGTSSISGLTSPTTLNTIEISGTLNAPTSLNVSGNFTNNGTFTHNNGTITFTGNSTLAGSSLSFYNVTISNTLVGPLNSSFDIYGTFTNNGSFSHNNSTINFKNINSILSGTSSSTFYNVTIDPTVQFTVPNGTTFRVAGDLRLKGNTTTTASLLEEPTGSSIVTGFTYVEKYWTGTTWHYYSSPVSNATTNDFLGYFVRKYNEPTLNYTSLLNNYTTLETMRGYTVKRGTGSQSLVIKGALNTGSKSYNLSYTPSIVNAEDRGWNIVGNPYPSAIDWDDPDWTKTNVDDAVYFFNEATASYHTYIGGVGTPGSVTSIIPAMQGFFAIANNTGASLAVNNGVRLHSAQTYYKKSATTQQLIRLAASGDVYTDEAVVRFNNDAANGFDSNFDAYKIDGGSDGVPQISTVINDNERIALAINTMPFDYTTTIPVAFTSKTAGKFKIEATEIANLEEYQQVLLTDITTGKSIDLRTNHYAFNYTPENNSDRFLLSFIPVITAIDQAPNQSASIFAHDRTLYITSDISQNGTIEIFDISGKLILSRHISFNNTAEVSLNTLESGIYIVRFVSEKETAKQRVKIL